MNQVIYIFNVFPSGKDEEEPKPKKDYKNDCRDFDDQCPIFKKNGKCEESEEVREQTCRKSCGACGDGRPRG